MPMPSPRYRLGGILRKLGTDSYGISGTFCTLALVASAAAERPCGFGGACANTGAADRATTSQDFLLIFIDGLRKISRTVYCKARRPGARGIPCSNLSLARPTPRLEKAAVVDGALRVAGRA